MKRVTKHERQLYELLDQLSGLLSDPDVYGMRSFYAMPGTIAREELIGRLEATLEPYRTLRGAEDDAAHNAAIEREYLEENQ